MQFSGKVDSNSNKRESFKGGKHTYSTLSKTTTIKTTTHKYEENREGELSFQSESDLGGDVYKDPVSSSEMSPTRGYLPISYQANT